MILEALALGSVLYVGFKALKNGDKNAIPLEEDPEGSVTNIGTKLNSVIKTSAKSTQEEEEEHKKIMAAITRDRRAGFWAFALAAGGFLYRPLGILSVPFLVYSARQSFKQAYRLIKKGKVDVNTLISITLIGAMLIGRFFIAGLILVLINWAIKLTAELAESSRHQLLDAFGKHPDSVWILVDNVEVSVPFNDLKKGDTVVVQAGEMIPADGTVIKGMATVDQHILTGEAKPVERGPDEGVFGSTMVLSGKIYVNVEKAGEESTVSKISQILNSTVDFKSSTQLRAELFSENLVKPALLAGAFAWPLLGFSSALAVINAHPKNKIMIIAPITILNYLGLASRQGILVKDGRSLELLNKVDTLVFDKTGTLTETQPHVGGIHCYSDYDENEILCFAAAAESKQTHPLAKAILQEAEERRLTLPVINDSEYKIGYGLTVEIAGQQIHVGSERFMAAENLPMPMDLQDKQALCNQEGYTLVVVAVDNQVVGGIELLPTIRPEAKEIIAQLKQRENIKSMYIISGDNEVPTRNLARELGIDHYFAETLPENKAGLIEQLQEEGHFICYVGDGINDSIALKKSQVSVSLRGASTIATDTAQIVLMDEGLNHLNAVFDLAESFNANMNRTFAILLLPAIIGVSGAFLLGFGLGTTVALNLTGLLAGIGNSMTPLLQGPAKQKIEPPEPPQTK
uniref:P-type Zn(2+) transporter n=1 Tax=Candidatus Kentrum sp. FM TaxID=2126340 RepID=A0A450TGX5_9GAMM|nr:MAG: Cu2+-exporting ATPase [Candidatus Kentron sp. FM]VFJ66704.1 MAG: Cu2+-exporting ATPase [Candidatus Kentron sp. FM]VFK16353.1 MAG: Cu2+-exporting ATPase [Candidatus Kentron sp. FM]